MARLDDAESAKKIRKAPQTILCGITPQRNAGGKFPQSAADGIVRCCLYYLSKEKEDPESRKIYTVISVIGGVVAVVCALLLFL